MKSTYTSQRKVFFIRIKTNKQLTGINDQLRKFMEQIQKPETHKHNTDKLAENKTNIKEKFCVKAKDKSCLNFLILVTCLNKLDFI